MLTPRQEVILRKVADGYAATGQPVGSKALAAELEWGPSTIRYELAELETRGLLAHPHTSAGRLPTEAGHRYLVDALLARPDQAPAPPPVALDLTQVRSELDDALRATTERLSEITNLLAVATAPGLDTATIRHIEVLTLRPNVVLVVLITSSGAVSKFVCSFDEPVDPGLVSWAGEYLNERVGGMGLGARMLLGRLADPALGPRERAFIERLTPAFTDLSTGAEDVLHIDGASRLLGAHGISDPFEAGELMALLEERVALLEMLRRALSQPGMYVRIGAENEVPGLQSLAVVAAGYGLAQRKLGTVSVIGPLRMDYGVAIASVRSVARVLSHFVEEVY